MATFNPTDDLVLNDGNLWDVRSNKLIYKFDKFNQYTSGCFHPRGLEVVINSEIASFISEWQECLSYLLYFFFLSLYVA